MDTRRKSKLYSSRWSTDVADMGISLEEWKKQNGALTKRIMDLMPDGHVDKYIRWALCVSRRRNIPIEQIVSMEESIQGNDNEAGALQ